ncbi:glycosyltransferase family 4 protein [Elusimicrobiota bacterium]
MKLLYISNAELPSDAANSIQIMEMCSAFARAGHNVMLLTPDYTNKEIQDKELYERYNMMQSFRVVRLPVFWSGPFWLKRIALFLFNFKAACYAINEKADLYYSRSPVPLLFLTLWGCRSVLELHSTPDTWMKKMMICFLCRRPTFFRIVSISFAMAENLSSLVPANKLQVSHDGARAVNIPLPESQQSKEIKIGYAGHLYRGKGGELITEIAGIMPECSIHIYGGTKDDIKRYQKNAPGNMVFYGHLNRKEIMEVLEKLDIVLLPVKKTVYARNGKLNIADIMSPLKLFEYMSLGKAIVASNLPVIREVLESGRNSVLCDPDDAGEWKNAIKKLLEDSNLRTDLGRAAHNDFMNSYTWEIRARKVLEGI